jgi:RimJ/RimL family protein N-acetyltransferase
MSLMRGDSADSYKAPDIGFAIVPEETGKGYATEAAQGLVDYATRNLGVDAVFAFFEKGNAHSRRVVQKLGFENRGVRALKAFGGAESEVWVLPGMDADLAVYGVE